MTNISLIAQQLRNRQNQIEEKINQLLSQNLDPFPFDRLEKRKKLFELIQKTLAAIEADDLIRAGMHIKKLKLAGLKLYV
ncbi:hypothetical protein [Lunatibacter salilacus]|uniref:hypothetical protein n=1 Tax=Lunatibacter salilacus TaxID=2483804 RepID=UPI00131DEB27|nr:hypothetical protein [Lunatibacter salilacus]